MKNIILVLILSATVLAGCAKPKAESHSNTGVIVSIEQDGKIITIKHGAFPDGFMEGMTMPYETVDPAQAQGLKKGDKVEFTVTRQENFYPLTDIKKVP